MTHNPTAIKSSTSPVEALTLMHTHRFRHLPVVTRSGALAGLLDILHLTRDCVVHDAEADDGAGGMGPSSGVLSPVGGAHANLLSPPAASLHRTGGSTSFTSSSDDDDAFRSFDAADPNSSFASAVGAHSGAATSNDDSFFECEDDLPLAASPAHKRVMMAGETGTMGSPAAAVPAAGPHSPRHRSSLAATAGLATPTTPTSPGRAVLGAAVSPARSGASWFFKFQHEDRIFRACASGTSFAELVAKVTQRLGGDFADLPPSALGLSYVDDEGDAVQLTCDSELRDVVSLAQHFDWKVIRLNVTTTIITSTTTITAEAASTPVVDAADPTAPALSDADGSELSGGGEPEEGSPAAPTGVDDGSVNDANKAVSNNNKADGNAIAETNPGPAYGEEQRGNDKIKASLFEEAAEHYKNALQAAAAADDATGRARIQTKLGTVYSILGDHTEAYDAFAAVVDLVDGAGLPAIVRDTAYGGQCDVLLETGQYERAAEAAGLIDDDGMARDCLDRLAGEESDFKNLGRSLWTREDYMQAMNAYTKAIRINAAVHGVDKARRAGDGDGNGNDNGGEEAHRLDHTLYSNRAACYMKIGDYGMAVGDCEMCMHIEPAFVKAYLRLGQSLLALGKLEPAVAAFHAGLEYDQAHPGIRDALGTLEAAAKAQRSATENAPDEGPIETVESSTATAEPLPVEVTVTAATPEASVEVTQETAPSPAADASATVVAPAAEIVPEAKASATPAPAPVAPVTPRRTPRTPRRHPATPQTPISASISNRVTASPGTAALSPVAAEGAAVVTQVIELNVKAHIRKVRTLLALGRADEAANAVTAARKLGAQSPALLRDLDAIEDEVAAVLGGPASPRSGPVRLRPSTPKRPLPPLPVGDSEGVKDAEPDEAASNGGGDGGSMEADSGAVDQPALAAPPLDLAAQLAALNAMASTVAVGSGDENVAPKTSSNVEAAAAPAPADPAPKPPAAPEPSPDVAAQLAALNAMMSGINPSS